MSGRSFQYRRSEYRDSDGIVSVMMSVPYEQLSPPPQRQKLVDALNMIIGNNTNVRARLEAIRPLPGDTSSEVASFLSCFDFMPHKSIDH